MHPGEIVDQQQVAFQNGAMKRPTGLDPRNVVLEQTRSYAQFIDLGFGVLSNVMFEYAGSYAFQPIKVYGVDVTFNDLQSDLPVFDDLVGHHRAAEQIAGSGVETCNGISERINLGQSDFLAEQIGVQCRQIGAGKGGGAVVVDPGQGEADVFGTGGRRVNARRRDPEQSGDGQRIRFPLEATLDLAFAGRTREIGGRSGPWQESQQQPLGHCSTVPGGSHAGLPCFLNQSVSLR